MIEPSRSSPSCSSSKEWRSAKTDVGKQHIFQLWGEADGKERAVGYRSVERHGDDEASRWESASGSRGQRRPSSTDFLWAERHSLFGDRRWIRPTSPLRAEVFYRMYRDRLVGVAGGSGIASPETSVQLQGGALRWRRNSLCRF